MKKQILALIALFYVLSSFTLFGQDSILVDSIELLEYRCFS